MHHIIFEGINESRFSTTSFTQKKNINYFCKVFFLLLWLVLLNLFWKLQNLTNVRLFDNFVFKIKVFYYWFSQINFIMRAFFDKENKNLISRQLFHSWFSFLVSFPSIFSKKASKDSYTFEKLIAKSTESSNLHLSIKLTIFLSTFLIWMIFLMRSLEKFIRFISSLLLPNNCSHISSCFKEIQIQLLFNIVRFWINKFYWTFFSWRCKQHEIAVHFCNIYITCLVFYRFWGRRIFKKKIQNKLMKSNKVIFQ